MQRVGFIGLGKMGLPMCRNLLKAGFPVTVYNRSHAVTETLVREGAKQAASSAAVAEGSEIVLTCLPNIPAVEQVYLGTSGIMSRLRSGQVAVDHSTVSPQTSRSLYETAKAKGAGFLDAPVSGGPAGAQGATLTIMVGGDADVFQKALPLFQAMGKNIHHVGPSPSGTVVKLANQLLVGIHAVAAAEALVLATKAGADPKIVLEVVGTSYGASAMLNRNGPMILERRFDPGTPVDLILKDLRIINALADESHVRLLMGSLAKQAFTEASQLGLGPRDMAAMVQPVERLAGVEVKRNGRT